MESPLQRAQLLDSRAEETERQGNTGQAIDLRQQAALAYKEASNSVQDASVKRTLSLLSDKQLMLVKELQDKQRRQQSVKPTAQPLNARAPSNDRHGQLLPRPKRTSMEPSASRRSEAPRNNLDLRALKRSDSSPTNSSLLSSKEPNASIYSSNSQSIYPEGSYMLLRDDNNSSDPFLKFNKAVEGLLDKYSSPAVAFATAPLSSPSRKSMQKGKQDGKMRGLADGKDQPADHTNPMLEDPAESFYFIPSTPASSNTSKPSVQSRNTELERPSSNKSIEELTLENASLKSTVDELASQLHTLLRSNQKEKAQLKESVLDLGRDLRREAEKPSAQLLRLQDELDVANAAAAKYKARYESLREAIKKKKIAKEAAEAAAAAASAK